MTGSGPDPEAERLRSEIAALQAENSDLRRQLKEMDAATNTSGSSGPEQQHTTRRVDPAEQLPDGLVRYDEGELVQTLGNLNAVLEQIEYGTLLLDADLKTRFANRALRNM